jgi:hypothetical protein
VIASKLDLRQPVEWVESELSGYNGEVPEYRIISGHAKTRNPYHGWQPLLFGDAELERMVCEQKVPNPVRELEHLLASDQEIVVHLSGRQVEMLCQMAGMPMLPIDIFIPKNGVLRILDTVRNRILDWSLALQRAGIRGEGLTFSVREKAVAHDPTVTYNIGTIGSFAGNIGGNVGGDVNATSSQVSASDIVKISELTRQIRAVDYQMGLTPTAQHELRETVDALDGEIAEPSPKRGRIAGLLHSVRTIAEGAAGNVVATGVGALAGSIF